MNNTVFYSVHGLPPSGKNPPDVTTARDMAKLSRELLKYPEVVKYTSTKVREFRPDAPEPFIMRTHNHLLKDFEGCDGLKTGYFRAAGFFHMRHCPEKRCAGNCGCFRESQQ